MTKCSLKYAVVHPPSVNATTPASGLGTASVISCELGNAAMRRLTLVRGSSLVMTELHEFGKGGLHSADPGALLHAGPACS